MHLRSIPVRASLLVSFTLVTGTARSQCPNNNTAIAGGAITPACPGTTNVPCVQGGQYALVNVVSGNWYTFSTCGASFDTQLTLYNNAGGVALANNDDACGTQSIMNWAATFTGQVRVLVDRWTLFNACASVATCAPLAITCTPPPTGGCMYVLNMNDSFGDGWGTSYVGVSINGGPYQNYTVSGYNNSVPIPAMPGDVIVLNYNASGAFQGENSYTLTLGGGAVFNSGSPPLAGNAYAGTLTCTPPPAPPEDCVGSVTICSGQSFNNNTNNTGNVADLTTTTAGCLLNTERQGTWYNFSPSAGGQIGFTINPANPSDDYDFAIWGPFPSGSTPSTACPPLNTPLRCSYAAPGGATGLNFTATDLSEPAGGDKWVRYLDVTVGQVYLLYISNWSQSGLAFSLSWNLQGGASLDCTVLEATAIDIEARTVPEGIALDWTTYSERNSSHFIIERSTDGMTFIPVGQVPSQGPSTTARTYSFLDLAPSMGLNYYRIEQVERSGSMAPTRTVSAKHGSMGDQPILVPNPSADHTTVYFHSPSEGTAIIEVLDARGRTAARWTLSAVQGPNSFVAPLSAMDAGAYLLRVTVGGEAPMQTRLVKF